ncbi:MAG TPA: hypothetical protein VL443_09190 [Cyclobacteriaceae bacterium]|jgi:hypothetical protein|nr:hypothetical protein [Cyclobacteriaceae bacterium]
MELNDLEKIWKEKDRNEGSIKINEKILLKRNYDNASSEFEKLLKLSILGRNLALIYFIVSLLMVYLVGNATVIASLGIVGAIGMLLSFIYHFSYTNRLRKLNYYSMPVVDLQKAINEFRVKSVGAGKYDFMVVLLWIATISPMVIQYFFGKNLYTYFELSISNTLILIVVLLVLYAANKQMYKTLYEDKLLKAEADLKEILEFEI